MFERDLATVHYDQLLATADTILEGPLSVGVGSNFWGEPNLTLCLETMPRIEGAIESRIVYANLGDEGQNVAILRQAAWDAQATRRTVLQEFRQGREPSIYPILLVRYVWIDIGWLSNAVHRLEELVIPLRSPKMIPLFRTMYRLRIARTDRTVADISWGKGMVEGFQVVSDLWESLWQEMTGLLNTGEIIEPHEFWGRGFESVTAYKVSDR
ncbi:MAG: hypothetical protein JXM73_17715 [Anaerolineae bacterium]|nr:hypothetical protein [Anaerolineae bacterium]